jgi:hypothetical protein
LGGNHNEQLDQRRTCIHAHWLQCQLAQHPNGDRGAFRGRDFP